MQWVQAEVLSTTGVVGCELHEPWPRRRAPPRRRARARRWEQLRGKKRSARRGGKGAGLTVRHTVAGDNLVAAGGPEWTASVTIERGRR